NAFISSLDRASYPLEFKLLDYAPEPWSPLKSAVLLKNMQWVLTRDREDVRLARVVDSLGAGFFSRYYPVRHPGAEAVFPREVLPASARDEAVDSATGRTPRHARRPDPVGFPNTQGVGADGEGGGGGDVRAVGERATPAWGTPATSVAEEAHGNSAESEESAERAMPDYPGMLAARPDPSS